MITDDTPMPFGKYKNMPIGEVPGKYLLWLYDDIKPTAPNKRSAFHAELVDYVEDNMDAIKKEANL